jgi:hypothetical protein
MLKNRSDRTEHRQAKALVAQGRYASIDTIGASSIILTALPLTTAQIISEIFSAMRKSNRSHASRRRSREIDIEKMRASNTLRKNKRAPMSRARF